MDDLSPNDNPTYIATIPFPYKDALYKIRHWENIHLGIADNQIWVKGLSLMQMNEIAIKTMMHLKRYYLKDGKIFTLGSMLPEKALPALKWTAIEGALSVSLPHFNHNYFEITETITVQLTTSEEEVISNALLCSLTILDRYIQNASKRRLERIHWVILPDSQEAFLIGIPVLPISGQGYWQQDDSFLPNGLKYETNITQPLIKQTLNPKGDHYIIWNSKDNYFLIPKNDFSELSKSSFNQMKTTIEQP